MVVLQGVSDRAEGFLALAGPASAFTAHRLPVLRSQGTAIVTPGCRPRALHQLESREPAPVPTESYRKGESANATFSVKFFHP
jgi:hypothetical protein